MVPEGDGNDSAVKKEQYENKIAEILKKLQDTVEALEFDFKEQLYERQELIRQLLEQLQLKNFEFVEYLTNVQDTTDRKIINLKLDYETKLNGILEQQDTLQLNVAIAEKRFSDANDAYYSKWIVERVDLLEQYDLDQGKIRCYENQLEILRKELRSRETTLNNNEMHLLKCKATIEEVEKRKENFTLTVKELRDECDALQRECDEKNEQISYLTIEKNQLERDITTKDLQIEALNGKVEIARHQMENERLRRMTMETTLSRINEDIRRISESIQNIPELKKLIFEMREKFLG